MSTSIDPDETANYEPSIWIYDVCITYLAVKHSCP